MNVAGKKYLSIVIPKIYHRFVAMPRQKQMWNNVLHVREQVLTAHLAEYQ
jgi:hypothetical protein